MEKCPCGSGLTYQECCEPIIKGERKALTPEAVMRSRYTAYAKMEMDHLFATLDPDNRADYDARSTRKWAEQSTWHSLEILETSGGGADDTEGRVDFVAIFSANGARQEHRERATFKKRGDTWYFVDGKPLKAKQVVRDEAKVGRNDPCPCGSGKKFKKCCGA